MDVSTADQRRGATILVVDDDPGIQAMLIAILEDEGYRVLIARDGAEALALLETSRPDLIVLDLMMPRMSGQAFAAERLRRRLHPEVPLMVLTAAARGAEQSAEVGAQAVLEKPFDLPDFLDIINRLVRESLLSGNPAYHADSA